MARVPFVVILEDDIEFGVRLSMELNNADFEVIRFTTATRALEFISNNRVDLVIADILIKIEGALVEDGGIKLISRLRQLNKHPAPIIAMSSLFSRTVGARSAISTAATVGADAIIAKPFQTDELVATMRVLLSLEGVRGYRTNIFGGKH